MSNIPVTVNIKKNSDVMHNSPRNSKILKPQKKKNNKENKKET